MGKFTTLTIVARILPYGVPFSFKGRDAWSLQLLQEAGVKGYTPIDNSKLAFAGEGGMTRRPDPSPDARARGIWRVREINLLKCPTCGCDRSCGFAGSLPSARTTGKNPENYAF